MVLPTMNHEASEKKAIEAIDEEMIEEVPLILESESLAIGEDDKDKDAEETVELLQEKSNNGKSDKG